MKKKIEELLADSDLSDDITSTMQTKSGQEVVAKLLSLFQQEIEKVIDKILGNKFNGKIESEDLDGIAQRLLEQRKRIK